MIARFGSTELTCLSNYMSIKNNQFNILKYIKGEISPWWWEPKIFKQMQDWSGFFPPNQKNIEKFCELMIKDIEQLDMLGSWQLKENIFQKQLKNIFKVRLTSLEPFWAKKPWTLSLEGKKVLVVHPFAETINMQYKKRTLLFKTNRLPSFDLKTVKAVQSIAGNKTAFKDWFDALDYMKSQIDSIDYDVCLIGAGAYGFPLAAHVKRSGKKAIHIGGSLQLLFGIRGKRWEKDDYHEKFNYKELINSNWVRPNSNEQPKNSELVEDNCYW